ncbi:MAG: 6-phosphogluconolactonase [Anaerolineae bacterium]
MNEVKVYSDAESLARAAAEHFLTLAREAAKARGRFNVALSGGQTPRRLYEILAGPPFRESIPWARVQIFWGDERCVPPTHPESNYRMAREALLDKIPIPQENIHRIQGELPPDQAAAAYQMELEATLGVNGRLDLILLGMGADGHTASLFPGSEAIHERARWVVAQYVEKLRAWRITLTPAAINAAANVIFLVSGVGKAESLRQALAGPYQPCILPAQLISPVDGHLLWLADTEAAALL